MKKSILKGMMAALGIAAAGCAGLCAAVFRPQGVQWVVLVGAALAAFAGSALIGTRLTENALRPLHRFWGDLTAARLQGTPLTPESYPYEELKAIGEEVTLLCARTDTISRRLTWERGQIKNALDALTDGVLFLDSSQQVVYANPAVCQAFGMERTALTGTPLSSAACASPLTEGVVRAAYTPYPITAHISLAEHRFGEASIQCVPTKEDGTDDGVMIVIHDVTAQHESEQVRKDFFDAASRILRTPTERIKGLAELLCSDMPLGGNKLEDVSKRLLAESRRLAAIMGKLTVLTRLENGDLVLPRVPFDFAALVQERCMRMENTAKRLGVVLTRQAQDCTFCAARGEIAVLLDELLDNALRFNRKGGRVEVSLTVENTAPCLRVFSTGDVLTAEQARHIFERFYHGKNATGAGLGLAIVRQIAMQYDGAVLVTPAPKGNLFSVRFPAQP